MYKWEQSPLWGGSWRQDHLQPRLIPDKFPDKLNDHWEELVNGAQVDRGSWSLWFQGQNPLRH